MKAIENNEMQKKPMNKVHRFQVISATATS